MHHALSRDLIHCLTTQKTFLPFTKLVWQASSFTREEGSGVCHAYTRVVLLQAGVQPNQIVPCHIKINMVGLFQTCRLTNQVPDLLVQYYLLGLFPARALTNQLPDLHECGFTQRV